jgi:beta-N-acetylhexosaminidase
MKSALPALKVLNPKYKNAERCHPEERSSPACMPAYWLNYLLRLLHISLLLALLNPVALVQAAYPHQGITPLEQAQQFLDRLSPEERVGQLFLATFEGMNSESGSQIYDLIVNQHIGGVMLLAENDNFNNSPDGLASLLAMNRQLQLDRWAASQQPRTTSTGEVFTPAFIPLFIAIPQEGDGYPYDQILNGLTPLPNEMAMGATWNPNLVSQVGSVLGKELSSLGFNLLLGPSLDVLEAPAPEGGSGLGTRAFGGDPFWVGKLGKAFITGVHSGSAGKMAVVASHFPGNGAADRLPEEEVATVRKSLEELQNFDLAPFFEVTGNAPSPEATADALLTSHIRYQGFQGNIRATTRPISFDQQAFNLLMNLPVLSAWRQNGGVMVSDNLGSRAVRRFYELTTPNQPFDAGRVALNAFLAGNDLLYLGKITSGDDPDAYTTTINILSFFAQKYRDDSAFAQRVDESALRILALKFRLYGEFTLNRTLPSPDNLENLGQSSQVIFDVAQQGATLISPTMDELDEAVPDPPDRNDRIVFITDARSTRQCSQCDEQPVFPVDGLQQAVLRLYGPDAGRQVTPWFLISYSYQDLLKVLDNGEDSFQIQRDLSRANWLVFAMLNVRQDDPTTLALHRFLAERPDLFQQKRVVVFAFNAPYYLDATNIAKLTAFYGLYSKTPSFIDVAARLLFRELRPAGALPISVPGVGYDLISATMPDPNQSIPVMLDTPAENNSSNTPTPTTQPASDFRVGSIVPVRTGVILDHNAHPVPDGTPVQFVATINGEVIALPQVVNTLDGIARTTIQITGSGMLEIRAESEPAKRSDVLRFDIPAENGDLTPTATEHPTETLTPSPSPTNQPTLTALETSTPLLRPDLTDWIMAMIMAAFVGFVSYRLAAYIGQVRWGVRSGFLALIGGLTAYCYLALGLPGSQSLLESVGAWGIVLITLLGSAAGILAAWSWRALRLGSKP